MKKHLIKLTILLLLASSIAKVNAQWVAQTSGTEWATLYNGHFTSEDIGYIVGSNGVILKTTNGGNTWTRQTSGTSNGLLSVYFTDENTGYAVGQNGTILKTINGGTAWEAQTSSTTNVLNSVFFTDESTGYVVGGFSDAAVILKTTNGGTTWTEQSNGTIKGLKSVVFTSDQIGYAVGFGTILKTTNAGESWTEQTYNATLNSVFFTDNNTGFAVGRIAGSIGLILKTVNGGITWTSQTTSNSNDLQSVNFTDGITGYVVGQNGTILNTANGGATWVAQSSGTTDSFNSIIFLGESVGYIIGNWGTIFKTTNGGWCTGAPGQPVGEVNVCNPATEYSYTTTGAEFAESYEWTLNPSIAGTITGTGTTASVTWSGSYNGEVTVKVQGVKEGCTGEFSTLKVAVNNSSGSPSAFSLSSPANGIWVSATPLFQWATSTGAIYYDLYIDGALFKSNITSSSYQVLNEEALASGMHTWYVIASNGCTTQSNETRSFRVDATPPSAFSITAPADDSWTSELKPTFEWSASSDAQSGLAKYQLWVNGSLNRDNISSSASSTTPVTDLANGTHSWEIRAVDNVGNVINSNQSFSLKIDNTPPGSPDYFARILNNDMRGFYAENTNNYFNPQNKLTIEGRFKLTSTSTFDMTLMNLNNYECKIDYSIIIRPNYEIRFYLNDVGTVTYQSSINELMNNWNHFAGVFDGVNMILYMNGEQVAISNVGARLIKRNPFTYFKIGYMNCTASGSRRFIGDIDEIRVWNYPRSQQQINAVMNTEIEASDGLLAYWRFNESFLDDFSGNANTLNYYSPSAPPQQVLKTTDFLGNSNHLIFPENNQYVGTNKPMFVWNKTIDEGVGFEKYSVLINNVLVADNIIDTLYSAITPLNYGFNVWSVRAFDALGNSRPSVSRIFYIDNAPPNPFNLTAPANHEIVMFPTPNLSWQAATDSTGGSGMSKYQLWINGEIDRDSISIGTTTTSPSTALPQGEYTWFVKAFDKVGNVRQSTETRTFYVDWEAPTDFSLIEPIDNVTVSTSKPSFKWEQSFDIGSGIDKYELTISGQTPIDIPPTDTTHTITFDLPNGNYTWFVKAYDLANAFTSSNTHNLIVDVPLPGKAETPTGDNELCINAPNTDYTTAGATNATSYIWEISPVNAGTITGTGLTATVDWNNIYTGTAEISVKGENQVGIGTVSDAYMVTIYPATEAGWVDESKDICLGQSTGTLTITNYTGSILKWQKSYNGGIWEDITETTATYSETPAMDGQWLYRAEVKSGVCSAEFSTAAMINVIDLPVAAGTISGDATVCQGQSSVTYTVPTIANATSYIWSLPNGATGASTTNSIDVDFGTTAISGNITVKGTNNCGDGTISTLPLTVNVKPTTPVITLNGLVLQSDAPNGNQWYDQNGLINGATTQSHTVTVNGDYYVIVTLSGCSSDPSNTINVIVTNIEVLESGRVVKVYPNPVSNELVIEIEGNNGKVNLDILNSIGQVVFKGYLVEKTTIKTSNFAPGVYLIKLENGSTFEFKKIIKQ